MLNKIPLRALIIEDVDDDAQILLHALRTSGYEPTYLRVDDRPSLEEALQQPWQIVFSDFTMPTFDGIKALRLVRQHDPDLPFIFVSGTIGEELAVEAVKSGAQDYILKGNLKRLSATVPRELREAEMRRERRRVAHRLHHMANYDELTALPNHNLYHQRLAQLINSAKRSRCKLAVILFNLDSFWKINNRFGRQAGDEVLKEIGRRLSGITGGNDVAARLSGNEFAIIVPALSSIHELLDTVRNLQAHLASPLLLAGYSIHLRTSIGISLFPLHGQQAEEIHQNATLALHKVRHNGGGASRIFSRQLHDEQNERILMERELEQAINEQSLSLAFQPQVELSSNRILGVESLLRWTHPTRGNIPPSQVIPVAEESGLILPLGEWVLAESCRQIKAWRDAGIAHVPRMAVNFSAYQFNQKKLADIVRTVMDNLHLPLELLEVEITETALMQAPELSLKILNSLRSLGVSIALDDFGTGYSSLSYLKRFPVDVLKIDQSFIRDSPKDRDSVAIIRAIIALAKRLDIIVVAEGVESRAQVDFLLEEGCDLVQGYFFKKPVAPDEMAQLLIAGDSLQVP